MSPKLGAAVLADGEERLSLPGPAEAAGVPGGRKEFEEIWKRHAAALHRCCLCWTGGRAEDAEEALSRTAAVAFQKFPWAEASSAWERAWLLTVTRNVCMDLHRERKRKREEGLGAVDVEVSGTPSSPAPQNPEERFLEGEMRTFLWRSIRNLPPRLRGPMTLHVLQEMPYREIAAMLAISEVNVRKRLQEARDRLRRELRDYRSGSGRLLDDVALDCEGAPALLPPAAEAIPCRSLCCVRVALPDGSEADVLLPLGEAVTPRAAQRLETLAAYVRRHPGGWKRRLELARLLTTQGLWEEALVHYRAVVESRPDLFAPRAELGRVLRGAGRLEEAAALWKAGLAKATRPAVRLHLTALIESLRAGGTVEEPLRAAVAAEPESSAHAIALAEVLLERGRPVEALEVLDGVLALDPDNVAALLLSLEPLLAQGRSPEAERRAVQACEAEPGNPLARRLRGRGREIHGRPLPPFPER